ncbi:MAG TPA: DUF2207 domain-containing protein [Alphaproteobacteria bacterium]|nr:DUF2207 domain-containing protein [Alphaproteobacteria bacterium]HNS44388.1 DUF2207 domain-containing protein [Alphaproteobacteria bacterium]
MIRLIALCMILALVSLPARAAEVINNFDVLAVVHTDGSVDITENIVVNAEGNEIRRGIYRDIPTDYTDKLGNRVYVPLQITDIERDGAKEPYHAEGRANGTRIYIGNKDVYVSYGPHRYTIRYKVKRVIGFFDDYDEFYWNVTGNGWVFPIKQAQIRVEFPERGLIKQSSAYTGPAGAQGKNFESSVSGNIYDASITVPLGAYEGFTIAAAIQKGIITPETKLQSFYYFLEDNASWVVFGLTQMILAFFMLVSWKRYGDDTPGTIIPRFDIMDGITPDLLRYIWTQRYDDTVFSSLIVDAAAKKYLRITEGDDAITLGKIKAFPRYNEQNGMMDNLDTMFGGGDSVNIPLRRSSGYSPEASELARKLNAAKLLHLQGLRREGDRYFSLNTAIKLIGFLMAAAGFGAGIYFAHTDEQILAVGAASVVCYAVIAFVSNKPLNKFTPRGQKVADYAEGLRLYLKVAEEARMNALYPKNITPEIFEKFLPYALALGVEPEWSENFERIVAAQSREERKRTDAYLSTSSFRMTNMAAVGAAMATMSSAIAAASTPPGSSSGSGGGGSSGGGGGGGGGGGW